MDEQGVVVQAFEVDWNKIIINKKTGVYLNPDNQHYEFRGFIDQTRYVIVGDCPRIIDEKQLKRWRRQCLNYLKCLQTAH